MKQLKKLEVLLILNLLYSSNIFAFGDIYSPPPKQDTEIKEDGTIVAKDKKEGNEITLDSYGSQSIKRPDGSIVNNSTDGSQVIRNPDGSSISTAANGSKVILQTNGTSIKQNTDGSWNCTNIDGTTRIVKPNDENKIECNNP